jgi:hypothetical protein
MRRKRFAQVGAELRLRQAGDERRGERTVEQEPRQGEEQDDPCEIAGDRHDVRRTQVVGDVVRRSVQVHVAQQDSRRCYAAQALDAGIARSDRAALDRFHQLLLPTDQVWLRS